MKNGVVVSLVAGALIIGAGGAYLITSQKEESTVSTISETPKPKKQEVNVSKVLTAVKGKFNTVTETKVYTEQTDPNNKLGKPGSYVEAGAFWDTRTNYTPTESIPWGTSAGGSIEIFSNEQDAKERVALLQEVQGGVLDSGAVKQVGKVVIRASENLSKSQQDELISFLESQVQQ